MATKAKIEISLKDIFLATGQYIILCARTQVSNLGPTCYEGQSKITES